jgi:hypothetical protein
VTKCEFHPEEPVRYYCKDCYKALCAECVVNHARHDFIAANNMAANELKKLLYLTEGSVSERVALYSEILDKSEKKLVDMDDECKMQFRRLSLAFTEIREAIFQREFVLKKELHNKVREAQM